MSITDELRKWARNRAFVLSDPLFADRVDTYADNIDTAHERELREQYTKGHDDGFDEGFASADDWYVDHADALREHGWVRLPVDADGKTIRVGDELDGYGETTMVQDLTLVDDGWYMTCDNGIWHDPEAFTHHHEPTVEDALRELVAHVTLGVEWEEELFTEYADRIRKVVEHE